MTEPTITGIFTLAGTLSGGLFSDCKKCLRN